MQQTVSDNNRDSPVALKVRLAAPIPGAAQLRPLPQLALHRPTASEMR